MPEGRKSYLSMSQQELETLLRQDALLPEGEDMQPEELLAASAALAQLQKQTAAQQPAHKGRRIIIRAAILAAALAVLMALFTLAAGAFGWEIYDRITEWNKEIFQLPVPESSSGAAAPVPDDAFLYLEEGSVQA